jgi:thiamine biosynthesis lipoprotein ApbE
MKKRISLYIFLFFLLTSFDIFGAKELKLVSKNSIIKTTNINLSVAKKDAKKLNLIQQKIDSILTQINNDFSLSNKNSFTNQLNKNHEVVASSEFIKLFQTSYEIYANTRSTYNPTDFVYEEYWSKKIINNITKADSNALDTLYKYNIFSGFMNGDSINNKDTFHLLFMDDFMFKVSFETILPGYKLDKIKALLQSYNLKFYKIELSEQVFYANSFYNGSYKLSCNSEKNDEIGLDYTQNFKFNKTYYKLLKQSNTVRIWSTDATKACAYANVFCNTQLENNHQYWKDLIHFESEFK